MPVTVAQSIKPRSDVLRKRKFTRIDGQTTPSSDLPRFRASTPSGRSTPTRSQTPTQHRRSCRNPICTKPDVRFNAEDNSYVCQNCSVVAEQDSGLVAEQQFNEERGGRITAQGQTIGQDQTHLRARDQPTGAGGIEQYPMSRKQAEVAARQVMENFCTSLHIPISEIGAALRTWNLAYTEKFVLGRGISNVATVCLYLTLRGRKEQVHGVSRPKYPIMLMDFAEVGNVDVFSLGKMYTDLVRRLNVEGGALRGKTADYLAHGPEVLVDRFVDSLEFPPYAVRKIKDDAIRIVSRMKRDWINVGRRPAGVCGAAVILAARMNNFRRTTREVVLTAKVNEITLNKRLEEFSDLKSSHLSVKDFRDSDILDGIDPADPPAFARARDPPKPKRKRGRPKKNRGAPETAAEIEGDEADETVVQDDQPPSKRARVDAEGFAIPDLPRRQSQDNEAPTHRPSATPRLGRPKGAKSWRAPPITHAEEVIEQELERDIGIALSENPELENLKPGAPALPNPVVEGPVVETPAIENSEPEAAQSENQDIIIPVPGTEVALEDKTKHPVPAHIATALSNAAAAANLANTNNNIPMTTEIQPWEFDDDIEVSTCVLSEEERKIKETIWVNANRDYLRNEYAKQIKKQLKDAELRRRGIDPEKHAAEQKRSRAVRKDGLRRNGPLGNIEYLKQAKQRDESVSVADGSPIPDGLRANSVVSDGSVDAASRDRTRSPSTSAFPAYGGAAESMFAMMAQRRNAFSSSRINREAVIRTYGGTPPLSSSSPTSVSGSDRRSGSVSKGNSRKSRNSDLVFGAMGGKGTGLLRSKSSLAAERRENKKKEEARKNREETGSEASDAAGPSGARDESVSSEGSASAASASASASPTPTPIPTAAAQSSNITATTTQPRPQPPAHSSSPTNLQSPPQPLDDGSVEELIGSHTTTSSLSSHSRSQTSTPTADPFLRPGLGLSDPNPEDEDDEDDDGEDEYGLRGSDDDDDNDDEEGDDDDDGSEEDPATEPDLDDVFAGRSRR